VRVVDARTRHSLFYAPGLGEIEPHLQPFLAGADCVMLDGTFWTDDELVRLGISKKRARDMGHLPRAGRAGCSKRWSRCGPQDPHPINNTNRSDEDSPERASLDAAGIEVAYDGMEIEL
jgi:pyrroloquinoline quinone biosynthesis protein B